MRSQYVSLIARTADIDGYREGVGQVWAYRPGAAGETLTLVYESPGGAEMDSPDNLTVTPRGGLIA